MAVVPDSFLNDVARRFALLGDPTRLKIVSVLHECGECAVGQIAEAAGTSTANTSQHLQRLAAGGIVGRRRDGQVVRYRIIDDTIAELCAIVCGSVGGESGRAAGASEAGAAPARDDATVR
ncbi:MAG TPA: metalloregulator ArsR/SmtB family transcription factor [Streptosporangiaceae bacterium]|nr:metalloregulator ArsR/SmtB family transcription factor [Streptosporangiaceae bacterium]